MAMKPRLGREIALLMLPVLVFAGVAWWKNRAFFFANTSSDIAQQKRSDAPRILLPKWKRVAVSPADVAAGYDFAVETRPKVISRAGLPVGVRRSTQTVAFIANSQLKFKRQGKWFVVKQPLHKALIQNATRSGFDKNAPEAVDLRLYVRLEDVPRDAVEIQLWGRLQSTTYYSGAWPIQVKRPSTIQLDKWGGLTEDKFSPPFKIVIKGSAELFPSPNVSHLEAVEVLDARFSRAFGQFALQLWVKRKHWAVITQPEPKLHVWDGKLFDGNGQEINVFDSTGTNQGNAANRGWTSYSDGATGLELKSDEKLLFSIVNQASRGGWKNLKLPLRLEAKISDDNSWPTRFSGILREVNNYETPLFRAH